MPKPSDPRSLQAVLFDWDGTLLDSADADSSAYLAMFRELGIPWGLRELATHYTPNWHHVYRAARHSAFEMGCRRQALGQALRPSQAEARFRHPQRPRLGRSPLSARPGHQRRPRPRPSPAPLLRPDAPIRHARLRRRHAAKETTPRPASACTQADVPQPACLRLRRRFAA